MSYRDKPRIWKTAYYILEDNCINGLSVHTEIVQASKKGGRSWQEWAIDIRRLCPDRMLRAVDNHYLTPSNDYKRIPPALKVTIKRIWQLADKRGLMKTGEYIAEQCMG